ncbi:MAG TPA: hypothetical protein VJV79_19600 [Polyangiaceae bacterium]|nr:hypothetical protein [Polyangiaceae bacterium]
MNDRRSSSDLGSSAEATLSAFPFPERDWERDARAVEERLTNSVRGSTDALLLAAPLPSEADEPSSASATATPLTNSGVRTQSLADLARRSVEKKQANERQMARESLALAAQQRKNPAPGAAPPAAASVNRVAAVGVAREASSPVASSHWPKVAFALPALALAAAALFWFQRPEPAPLVTTPVVPSAPIALAPSGVAAAPARAVEPDAPRGVDPNTLPGEAAPTAESAPAKIASAPAKASKTVLKDGQAAALAAGTDQSLPPDPTLRPADSRSGELPAKPSTGAVQAALGSVMSGARHCVAGDDAPSSAVVVFGSDGRVQHVTVSGAAAGKSSAACIEAQLSRARVQPFAASNFSVNATVRPE